MKLLFIHCVQGLIQCLYRYHITWPASVVLWIIQTNMSTFFSGRMKYDFIDLCTSNIFLVRFREFEWIQKSATDIFIKKMCSWILNKTAIYAWKVRLQLLCKIYISTKTQPLYSGSLKFWGIMMSVVVFILWSQTTWLGELLRLFTVCILAISAMCVMWYIQRVSVKLLTDDRLLTKWGSAGSFIAF